MKTVLNFKKRTIRRPGDLWREVEALKRMQEEIESDDVRVKILSAVSKDVAAILRKHASSSSCCV